MKITSEEIITKIRNQITAYQMNIRSDNKAQRYNINDRAEDFTIPLFKLLFGWNNLINLNEDQANFPGIDLGDYENRIAIQVTAETSLEKVKDTLTKFKEKGYSVSFDRLVIFMIQEKQESYSKEAINNVCNDEFDFNPQKDIIDLNDLMKFIKRLLLQELKEVLVLFQDETGFIENPPEMESEFKNKLAWQNEGGEKPLKTKRELVRSFIKDNGGILGAIAAIATVIGVIYQLFVGSPSTPVTNTTRTPTPTISTSSVPPSNKTPIAGFDNTNAATPIGGGTGIIIFEAYNAERKNLEIYQLDLRDPANSLINLSNNSFNDQNPVWSPDGTKIAFVSNRDEDREGYSDIYIMDPDGSNPENLTPKNGGRNLEPAWSPNGSKIAFVGYVPEGYSGIFVMDSDGENLKQTTIRGGQDRFPMFSKDGKKIYFINTGYNSYPTRCESCPYDLRSTFHENNDLKSIKVVPDIGYTYQASAYFHDDRFIYSFKGSDSNYNIWISNIDGKNRDNLTSNLEGNEFGPSFSPDGKYIAFIWEETSGERVLVIFDLDEREIFEKIPVPLEGLDNTSWQP